MSASQSVNNGAPISNVQTSNLPYFTQGNSFPSSVFNPVNLSSRPVNNNGLISSHATNAQFVLSNSSSSSVSFISNLPSQVVNNNVLTSSTQAPLLPSVIPSNSFSSTVPNLTNLPSQVINNNVLTLNAQASLGVASAINPIAAVNISNTNSTGFNYQPASLVSICNPLGCELPVSMKTKIVNWEYVDFDLLLEKCEFQDNNDKKGKALLFLESSPIEWNKGIIVPIFKKGARNDLNNYRGITLTSCVSKKFNRLVCDRISKFIEENDVLTEVQGGFRKDHRCEDHIFTIKSIIATRSAEKKPLT